LLNDFGVGAWLTCIILRGTATDRGEAEQSECVSVGLRLTWEGGRKEEGAGCELYLGVRGFVRVAWFLAIDKFTLTIWRVEGTRKCGESYHKASTTT